MHHESLCTLFVEPHLFEEMESFWRFFLANVFERDVVFLNSWSFRFNGGLDFGVIAVAGLLELFSFFLVSSPPFHH